MPPRRKPTSTTQKKAQQKLQRAIKRGDVEKPPPAPRKKTRTKTHLATSTNQQSIARVKNLQSVFIKPPPEYLDRTAKVASTVPLVRPIPPRSGVYDASLVCVPGTIDPSVSPLTCPKRPKWKYEMTKSEVEKNEEGLHRRWLQDTELHFASLKDNGSAVPADSSPTYFERNLQVWRQLWRVIEISAILCVLVDVRCPLFHLPDSLISYLQTFCPSSPVDPSPSSSLKNSTKCTQTKSVVLVLTKTDISEPPLVTAWSEYLTSKFPAWRIVPLHSYRRKEDGWSTQTTHRPKYIPTLQQDHRASLFATLQEAHAELLQKPVVAHELWKPPRGVPPNPLDWDAALHMSSLPAKAQDAHGSDDGTEDNSGVGGDPESDEDHFLTIGLLGQPNVGKSSLLNALFGKSKVRASKTPGKTKHFQTMFLTPDIRIADCPGLVFPSYTRMEAQVLSGILPIARMNAILGCMNWVGNLLPIEKILGLHHPQQHAEQEPDKRTWREGGPIHSTAQQESWTTVDILTAYAASKGWMTAKAGREDIMRAGNALLRALAEGRIKWSFVPPGSEVPQVMDNLGIGLLDQGDMEEGTDGIEEAFQSGSEHERMESSDEDISEGDSRSSAEEEPIKTGGTRFAALSLESDPE